MLKSIAPYIAHYADTLATVTGINVEVVDSHLIRIAGTGSYEEGVGKSIDQAGEVYKHVLEGDKSFVMDQPRNHPLCENCVNLNLCRESCSVSTPILYEGKAIGVIALVAFTEKERQLLLANLKVYVYFVEQIAMFLSLSIRGNQKEKETQRNLDMITQITNSSPKGVIVLDVKSQVSFINKLARELVLIQEEKELKEIHIKKTGSSIYGMEEFELTAPSGKVSLVGELITLDIDDPSMDKALIFDSLPDYAKMLSQYAATSEAGGLNDILGESKAIIELKKKVLQVSQTSSTILITGESGTGKEMFARAIHKASDRSDKAFIAINCGAIPDNLLESELFGYVSGAFTGARSSGHIGKFELADKGVLFLDEIGSMPLYLQVKLLRVLQERQIERLGSNRLIDVDVRIIAATNDKLPELIEEKMFREDLFYRLNVIPFKIPPLRERLEDIPLFADYFLEKYCELFSKPRIRPSSSLLSTLSKYAWPGNVREFENVMEYIVNIMDGGAYAPARILPEKILNASPKNNDTVDRIVPQESSPAPSLLPNEALSSRAEIYPLEEVERRAVLSAMEVYGDSAQGKQEAAAALGIGIATLYRKLKLYEEEGMD